MNALSTLLDQRGDALFQALLEHIQISVLALVIAVLISVPLGLYLTRHDRIAEPIIGVTAVLQTIPSLALLGLLIPLVGIGTFPAVIALFLYSLLPIVRNTYTGIKEVDSSLIEASKAMGMNSWRRLIKVELPLALSCHYGRNSHSDGTHYWYSDNRGSYRSGRTRKLNFAWYRPKR